MGKTDPQNAALNGTPGKVLLSWLWRRYLARHWLWLLGAGVLMVIEGVVPALLAYAMGPLFDDVFIGGNQDAMVLVGLAIMGAFMMRGLVSVAQKVVITRISQTTAGHIRSDMLRHLMRLDTGFHATHPPGHLIERVQGDVEAVNRVWSAIITGIGRDAVSVVALFTVTLLIDWRWTLVALVGIPLLVLPSFAIQKYVRRRARDSREIASQMATRLDEVFHGIAPIKLNALEEYQANRYERLIGRRVRAETRNVLGKSMIPALIDVMSGIGFVAVLFVGGGQIIDGTKTVGEFMSFFTAMSLTFEPLRRLGRVSGVLQTAAASIERVRDLLMREPVQKGPLPADAKPAPPMDQAPEIRLSDVDLSFGDHQVLRGTSFVAEAGKTTALVGASGAGKTTIFNLLTRLIEPNSGSVTLDGVSIQDILLTELRQRFSVVSQDAALFDESLLENLVLGRDVPDARVTEVIEAAHVADFLPLLPDGLNSPAGTRGSNLSGGQRQRVAIARALLRDTPILLLDEATSALDTKSESIVQDALERLSEGRTTLIIAHRLSTVRNADKIVVMDQGRVIEEGKHDDLLARGGAYADLYSMQFQGDNT